MSRPCLLMISVDAGLSSEIFYIHRRLLRLRQLELVEV